MIAEQTQFGLPSHGSPFNDDSEAMLFVGTGAYKIFKLRSDSLDSCLASVGLTIHQNDRKMVSLAFANSAAELSPLHLDFRAEHSDTGELWIKSRAVPVRQPQGYAVWHGYLQDITALKLTEKMLIEKQEKLRELVASRELLREDERARIAWEMHEDLGQMLAAMKLRMGGIQAQLAKEQSTLDADSKAIARLIDQSIQAVRSLVSDLRPAVLEHGTTAALEWLVEDFKKKSGKQCELKIDAADDSTSDQMTTQIFRIAQEVLEDIARCNEINSVLIAWSSNRDGLCLNVWHDGSESAPWDNSLIYFGLEERVRALGGVIQIDSGKNSGINIEVWLPSI